MVLHLSSNIKRTIQAFVKKQSVRVLTAAFIDNEDTLDTHIARNVPTIRLGFGHSTHFEERAKQYYFRQ